MTRDLAWLVGIAVAVVVTAAVVNSLAPAHRPRLRRVLALFVLAGVTYGIAVALDAVDSGQWASHLRMASEVVRAFVLINIGALLVFLVVLPRVGLALPVIAGELVAGVGYFIATLGVFARHDVDLSGALATGAVVSAVLAISMQQTLGNILGGVALQLDGSLHEGNWIQFENGKQGKIRAIRWRHTIVETRDFQAIVVPNAWLLGNIITILGQRDGKPVPQRCWAYFNVDFRFSPQRVCKAVDGGLRGSPIDNIAEEPAPTTLCLDYGKDLHDSYTSYGVQYYVNDMGRNDSTGSRVRMRIYAALQRADIPLAIPAQMQLQQIHDTGHVERHAKRQADAHFAAIKTVGLLRMLDEAELRTLADGLNLATFDAGEIITRQGAQAHYLYILTSGRVDIRAKIDPDGDGPAKALTRVVAELTAPDYFGEMGLITGEPRTADVVAATDVECYRLHKATFEGVLLERPAIAVELSQKLAERRVGLIVAREGLDEAARKAREDSERARILRGIKGFFGL